MKPVYSLKRSSLDQKSKSMNIEIFIKPALELIKGYAYGNKITRGELKNVLFLAKDFSGRDMFKLLAERNLIELTEGDPRFADDGDVYQISQSGFNIIDGN